MKKIYLLIFVFGLTLYSCRNKILKKINHRISTVDNNVCKRLYGDVLVYAIFVDNKATNPWTEYDINSTLDSLKKATDWIKKCAAERGIDLNINIKYHENKRTIPIVGQLPVKTVAKTLFSPIPEAGVIKLDKWADKISKIAGQSMPDDTTLVIKIKNKLNDRERLIARLRDIYKTDNVVLMFFVNNYYEEDLSLVLHSGCFDKIEYGIISFKRTAVIAHEFLHFFGALDLYITPFDGKKKIMKNKLLAMKQFPDEIMAFPYRQLDSLKISELTRYLIGWADTLSEENTKILVGKKLKLEKY